MSASSGDDELNLVPFIDLFSVLICFLLMTAVWMNIDTLSVDTSKTTSSDEQPPTPPPEKQIPLAVTVLSEEIHLSEGETITKIKLIVDDGGRPNLDEMLTVLTRWRATYAERKDVTLNTDDKVFYQTMISVFDTLVEQGWTDVGVNTL